MHERYTTEALVLTDYPLGDAHRTIRLFTRELGLLAGVATSVREERSRMRYSLQEGTQSLVSLVRGRTQWRIVGARELAQSARVEDATRRAVYVQLVALLARLLPTEEPDSELYDTLTEELAALGQGIPSREARTRGILLMLSVVHRLGYVADDEVMRSLPGAEFCGVRLVVPGESGATRAASRLVTKAVNASGL